MMQTLCWSSKAAGQERVWRLAKLKRKGLSKIKMKPPNCCNSSAARRVSENTDCNYVNFNRETSETQDIFSEFL